MSVWSESWVRPNEWAGTPHTHHHMTSVHEAATSRSVVSHLASEVVGRQPVRRTRRLSLAADTRSDQTATLTMRLPPRSSEPCRLQGGGWTAC